MLSQKHPSSKGKPAYAPCRLALFHIYDILDDTNGIKKKNHL